MAHHLLGIDLGAYSVKVLVANPGFRGITAVDFIERPVPRGDEPYEVRSARVLGQIVRERKLDADAAYAAAAGDKLFIHVLEMPFAGLRRADLEKAVGAELEGILPVDLEDMVFGFEPLPGKLGEEPAAESGEPAAQGAQGPGAMGDDEVTEVRGEVRGGRAQTGTAGVVHGRVAAPAAGMRVLACAMETRRARHLLDVLDEHAVEPRGLVAAPASYVRVVEHLSRFAGKAAGKSGVGVDPGPVAVIDIGHERTDVCVVQGGRAVYARTILRGGRHLTETIARAWKLSFEDAEKAKHADGFIGSSSEPPQSSQWQRVHEVVAAELVPWAGDLKRTLASCRAKTGASVTQVVLAGGGSRLRGMAGFLGDKLRVPVSLLSQDDTIEILGPMLASMGVRPDVACLAAGVAFEGATGRPHFDLRQGELAYKADLSFLRQKAATLAALAVVVMAFFVANGFASLYHLRADQEALTRRLALETTEVFGTRLSAEDTLQRTQGTAGAKKSVLPKMTAYDILLEINSRLPDRKNVHLDVRELDIKQGKITMKATAQSSPEIDTIEEELKKIDCFKVSRGNTSVGTNDLYEFSFTINSTCM